MARMSISRMNGPFAARALSSAAGKAFKASFGQEPYVVRAGYSIPVVTDFIANLPDAQVLVSGFSQETDGAHSPNEKMTLEHFHRATEMVLHLMDELSLS